MMTKRTLTHEKSNGVSEAKLQSMCFQYAWNYYPSMRGLLFMVNNDGKKNIIAAKKDKAMGIVRGIPDLVCMEPRCGIELKVGYKKQSKAQKEIEDVWAEHGIRIKVIYNYPDFKELLRKLWGETEVDEY